ncbi:MAG TPA: hypothetical protein VIJ10_11235, partial [Vicinamibacteria bacterium]
VEQLREERSFTEGAPGTLDEPRDKGLRRGRQTRSAPDHLGEPGDLPGRLEARERGGARAEFPDLEDVRARLDPGERAQPDRI